MFKVNDLVSIIDNPDLSQSNYLINIKGMSGYIEEISGKYARFSELNASGYGSFATIPLEYLKLENDNEALQALKKAKDDAFQATLSWYENLTKRYKVLLSQTSEIISNETGASTKSF